MTFTCQLCGDCCSTMGEIISIREEIAPFTFRIGYSTTGEERTVTVDPDKQDLYLSALPVPGPSLACPFLRRRAGREIICTVHETRPELCRRYSCFRLLVLDQDGRKAGRVMEGTRYFTAFDPRLHALWQKECAGLISADEHLWEDQVDHILTREGYRVIR